MLYASNTDEKGAGMQEIGTSVADEEPDAPPLADEDEDPGNEPPLDKEGKYITAYWDDDKDLRWISRWSTTRRRMNQSSTGPFGLEVLRRAAARGCRGQCPALPDWTPAVLSLARMWCL